MHEAPPGYLRAAQELLHRHKALLIADEVQTGLGRTGDFYAYQHEEGVEPDLVCVAKALSGGYVPVGATLGKDWIFKKVYSSMDRVLVHSASFGSNAQAMAAGLAVLSVMENEQIVENARATGDLLQHPAGRARSTGTSCSHDVRGRGLMIGIEFGRPKSLKLRSRWTMLQAARKGLFAQMVVVPLLQRHRILTQVSGDHLEVIKLIPPLVIGEARGRPLRRRLHRGDGRRARRRRPDVGLRQDPGQAGGGQPLAARRTGARAGRHLRPASRVRLGRAARQRVSSRSSARAAARGAPGRARDPRRGSGPPSPSPPRWCSKAVRRYSTRASNSGLSSSLTSGAMAAARAAVAAHHL